MDLKVHLEKGASGRVISTLVEEKQEDIVIMGTVARTGVKGLFIGTTAEKILRNVNCSVLTVNPESFKTPIKA
ncbi:MAG: universal stress protein [Gammaproteobacteria bacterium]|nr:universal stress protein [Gammaproteobacteria bacterium]